eukprot:Lithocolla_globosa_v1_NODE_10659_length_580_cov_3.908571.p2 type:complete len:130 gc:universal NODE_10659_length_580_cov_3.908571:102-491(+)
MSIRKRPLEPSVRRSRRLELSSSISCDLANGLRSFTFNPSVNSTIHSVKEDAAFSPMNISRFFSKTSRGFLFSTITTMYSGKTSSVYASNSVSFSLTALFSKGMLECTTPGISICLTRVEGFLTRKKNV